MSNLILYFILWFVLLFNNYFYCVSAVINDSCKTYQNIENGTTLLFYDKNIIVGAKNKVLRLSANLTVLNDIEWNIDNQTAVQCIHKGINKLSCHNYIKILYIHNSKLFVCGTYGYLPKCSYLEVCILCYI